MTAATAASRPAGTRMVATTRRVRTDDVLAHLDAAGGAFLSDDVQIATGGVVALVAPSEAAAVLGAIEHAPARGADHPAIGPIAIGALDFSGGGELVVPAEIAVRAGGVTWLTTIEPCAVAARPAPRIDRHARRFTVEASQDLDQWDAMVTAGLALVEGRSLRKVVLAREVVVEADAPFALPAVLERLRATQPACFVYADRGFVGATPELLVRRNGTEVTSRPMAGTVPRDALPSADDASRSALTRSAKNRNEHRFVVDAVVDALGPFCTALDVGEPEAVPLTTVTHLTTTIRGHLDRLDASALDLALALHPTPAVGGTPTARALEAIAAIEPFARGSYGAPVGWVNAHGDGEFAVALRCAELRGNRARLLAGAGIVAGSDPDSEWLETQAKLEPMLRTLVRP